MQARKSLQIVEILLWLKISKLSETLKSFGVKQSTRDRCVYYYVEGEIRTYIAIRVNDILIFLNNSKHKRKVKDL